MNKAESERLGSYFEELGYEVTGSAAEADLIVLNSCVVRQHAEDRVVNKLHTLKPLKQSNPNLTLAVTGCLVNADNAKLKGRFPQVDHFFGPGERPCWVEGERWGQILPRNPSPCTYVPIIQGCNNFCAYCIVPYRRGREKSRPIPEIVAEVRELVGRGTREVTLLGQNVDSYGHDLPCKPDLAELLYQLNPIEGLFRVRFLTNHPKDMSPRLIEAIAELDKVCQQLNLPVQAGSNQILKAMKRGYTIEQYRQLIDEIRNKIPEIALSTDVIVGFPGESQAQFRQTVDLLTELRFDAVHAAVYSPRPGTYAAENLADDVPPEEKKRRLDEVERLQEAIATEINARLRDTVLEVLVEGKARDRWQSRARNGKLVFFNDNSDRTGQLVKIRIEQTSPWSLRGKVES